MVLVTFIKDQKNKWIKSSSIQYDKIYINACNLKSFLMEYFCSLKKVVQSVYLCYIKPNFWVKLYVMAMFILVLSGPLFIAFYYEYYGLYPDFFWGMPRYEEVSIPLSVPKPPLSDDVVLSLKAAELLSEGGWTPEASVKLLRILYSEPTLSNDVALYLKAARLLSEGGWTPEASAKLFKILYSEPPVSGEAVLAQKR